MPTRFTEQFSIIFKSGYLSNHRPNVDNVKNVLIVKSIAEILFTSCFWIFSFIANNEFKPDSVVQVVEICSRVLLTPILILAIATIISIRFESVKTLKIVHIINTIYYTIVASLLVALVVIILITLVFELIARKNAHVTLILFFLYSMFLYGISNYAIWTYSVVDAVLENGLGNSLSSRLDESRISLEP